MSLYILKNKNGIYKLEFKSAQDDEYNNITTDEFLSVEEVATHIVTTMAEEDKQYLRHMPAGDLYRLHHGYGTWIRNTYGFWHPKNPYVVPDDLGDGHPDGLSMLVIESVHKQLTTKKLGD